MDLGMASSLAVLGDNALDVDGEATVSFVIVCVCGVLFLVLGISLTYAGIVPSNTVLVQSSYSLIALCVCTLQFLVFGSSLICESNSSWLGSFVGTWRDFFMLGMPETPDELTVYLSVRILKLIFSAVCAAIMVGATTQRGRFIPSLVFLFVWLTLVYDPVAYWCWNPEGWAYKLGVIDYAGGTTVHCTAGVTALVYAWHLGPRTETSRQLPSSSYLLVGIGTFLVWLGWVGFNSGSAMRPSFKALRALINTQISASAGGLTWLVMDHSFDRTWSLIGFCSGILSGLVCVTPAAAMIAPWASLIFGVLGGIVCNLSTKLKFYLEVDDALDIFAVHGAGGILGSLLTGILSEGGIWDRNPGLIKGNWRQVPLQALSVGAIVCYTAIVSHLILVALDRVIPLRITEDQEMVGLDLAEHGEIALPGLQTSSGQELANNMPHQSNFAKWNQPHVNVSMFPDSSDTPLLAVFKQRYYDGV